MPSRTSLREQVVFTAGRIIVMGGRARRGPRKRAVRMPEPLSDRGPLRIIYPLSAHPELDDDVHHARWI